MRTHRRPSALLAIALATAAVVIAAQPFASPWWRYADADSIYVGSALDIVHGDRTHYFDHPGLPLQEALAIVFTGTALVSGESPSQYARNGLTNFDRTRVVYRTFAALAFLALVAFAFRVGRRAFGGEQWGLAAALLVLAAPALAPLSIQVRPDVLLSLLVLAAAWQISEAWRTRIAAHFAGAALLIGCGTMLKAHAAGMLVPLVVTAIVRHPTEAWWSELRTRVGAWIRRRRTAAIGAALVWLALAVYLNVLAWPFGPAPSQRRLILEVIGIFVGFTAAAWAGRRLRFRAAERVFDPFYGFVAALVVAGVALPVSLFVGDGLTGIESVLRTLGGHGINENVVRFRWFRTLEQTYQTLSSAQIAPALPVFAAAILAGLVALRRGPFRG